MVNNNSIWYLLFHVFAKSHSYNDLYKQIKENPESKAQSVVFGKKSILFSVLFMLFLVGGIAIFYFATTLFKSTAVLLGIVLLPVGIAIAFYSIVFLVYALNTLIKQLRLNKKAIGFWALGIFILMLLIVVLGVLVVVIIK